MTKLTTHMRNVIRDRAVAAAFNPRFAANKEREAEVGRRLYDAVFPADVRAAAAAFPEKEWIRLDSCLRFNVGGLRMVFKVDPGLPVPWGGYGCHELGVITKQELIDLARACSDDKEALQSEQARASNALGAMLRSVSTIKKLAEVWPEGREFYASFEDAVSPILPAIVVADVNAMLGLPAHEATKDDVL